MRRPALLLALAVILVAGAALALGSVTSGSFTSSRTEYPELANGVGLNIRMQGVDPSGNALRMVLIPRASGSLGQDLPNGAFFTLPVVFNADVSTGPATINVPASSVRGGISAEVPLTGSESNYPFDDYTAALFASASTGETQADTGFLLTDALTVIPGFDIVSTPVGFLSGASDTESLSADATAGYGYVTWAIQRSNATKFVAILMGILMLMGAVVSLLITWAIVTSRRPPSINAMVWLAAFLFALFQVRQQLPGDPGSGIAFDRYLFFPVILILVLLIVVNLVVWSSREDWDLENPLYAVRGKVKR